MGDIITIIASQTALDSIWKCHYLSESNKNCYLGVLKQKLGFSFSVYFALVPIP